MGAFVLCAASARAQSGQPDLIGRGRQLFDDQRYEESIQTLSAALLRPNNTADEKVEIYRLLALDFITLGKNEEAESAVRGLLALRPDYALPVSESPRFRDFFTAVRGRWVAEGRPGLAKPSEAAQGHVAMAHNSPSQSPPDQRVALVVRLGDPQHRVTGVHLLYRTGSKGKFTAVDAGMIDDVARATIPATAVRPPLVEYYIEGVDWGGLPVVSRGDASAPLRIAVPEPKRATWVLPVAVGGALLGAAIIIGGLALTGVFSSGSDARSSTVSVTVR